MNYRAVGRRVALIKQAGIAGLIRRFSNTLPSRIAGFGTRVQGGLSSLANKFGMTEAAKRLATKAEGAKQLLKLGPMNPKQLEFIRTMRVAPGALGQMARGQGKALQSAFRTGLGTLGAGAALGGAALYDASTGKLFGGGQPQPQVAMQPQMNYPPAGYGY